MALELDHALYEEVKALCDGAQVKFHNGEYKEALPIYRQAFNKLPDQKKQWEAATWVLTPISLVKTISRE